MILAPLFGTALVAAVATDPDSWRTLRTRLAAQRFRRRKIDAAEPRFRAAASRRGTALD